MKTYYIFGVQRKQHILKYSREYNLWHKLTFYFVFILITPYCYSYMMLIVSRADSDKVQQPMNVSEGIKN